MTFPNSLTVLSLGPLLLMELIPEQRFHPHDPIISQRPYLLVFNTITLGFWIPTYEFWGEHKPSVYSSA